MEEEEGEEGEEDDDEEKEDDDDEEEEDEEDEEDEEEESKQHLAATKVFHALLKDQKKEELPEKTVLVSCSRPKPPVNSCLSSCHTKPELAHGFKLLTGWCNSAHVGYSRLAQLSP